MQRALDAKTLICLVKYEIIKIQIKKFHNVHIMRQRGYNINNNIMCTAEDCRWKNHTYRAHRASQSNDMDAMEGDGAEQKKN